jgi:RNA recognition motif-containing protein
MTDNKRLYVRNLGSSVDSSDLEDLFTMVGNVQSAQVVIDTLTGLSKCVGYVEMSTAQEAADCIQRFHNQPVSGQILSVAKDQPHISTAPPPSLTKARKKAPRARKSI